MNRNGHLVIQDEKGRDRERYQIPYGSRLLAKEGDPVEKEQIIVDSPDEKKQPTVEIKGKDGEVVVEYLAEPEEALDRGGEEII